MQLTQEFMVHKRLLEECALSDKFKFTHLIMNPEKYLQLMESQEIATYSFFNVAGTPQLFQGIIITISPLVETWKWVCDFE